MDHALSYKMTWKSGHLDNQDTVCWSQGVHNTQVQLYINFPLLRLIPTLLLIHNYSQLY